MAIQPEEVMAGAMEMEEDVLRIRNKNIKLSKYERIFLIGFGKGAAVISTGLAKLLGNFLTKGWVIDTVKGESKKIFFSIGTHPLPSKENIEFTETVLEETKDLTAKDLVLTVICGGGSALFEAPYKLSLGKLTKIFSTLLNSGANIKEMNVVRKHLSKVKGGGLAKHLFPAKIVSLIFSDVPGNDLSVIASGPTVRDTSTIKRAVNILEKYGVDGDEVPISALVELPKAEEYFDKVNNILVLSNVTALEAMLVEAGRLGYKGFIYSDRIQGEAKKVGKKLIELTPPGKILIAGGETTVKVMGKGKGGRNQTLALASLPIEDDTLILSFDSDGVDYFHFGGALVDRESTLKAQQRKLDPQEYLKNDDSSPFFEEIGDGILSGKLGSNVADLIMVLRLDQTA